LRAARGHATHRFKGADRCGRRAGLPSWSWARWLWVDMQSTRPPMTEPRDAVTWWRKRTWRRSRGMTRAELAVIRALLPQGDPRSELLFRQATDPPGVERRLVDERTCQVTIPYVKDAGLLIDVSCDCESPRLQVTDPANGRRLSLAVKVLRGGFLNGIFGVADDGLPWPLEWDVDLSRLGAVVSGRAFDWLPPMLSDATRQQIITELAGWAGRNAEPLLRCGRELFEVRPPAEAGSIAGAETRLGLLLPQDYREFVTVCNGFSIYHGRSYEVFGSEDTYPLALPMSGGQYLVLTDLYEEGVVALNCRGDETGRVVLLRPKVEKAELIGDLRTHVSESLEWLEGLVRLQLE